MDRFRFLGSAQNAASSGLGRGGARDKIDISLRFVFCIVRAQNTKLCISEVQRGYWITTAQDIRSFRVAALQHILCAAYFVRPREPSSVRQHTTPTSQNASRDIRHSFPVCERGQ